MSEANKIQVAGSHYKKGGQFQHWDLITGLFGPGYLIGCATKYITRWREKNQYSTFQRAWCRLAGVRLPTPEDDLKKARHYVKKLAEHYRDPIEPVDLDIFNASNNLYGFERVAVTHLIDSAAKSNTLSTKIAEQHIGFLLAEDE